MSNETVLKDLGLIAEKMTATMQHLEDTACISKADVFSVRDRLHFLHFLS